jgi:hypothetical protein
MIHSKLRRLLAAAALVSLVSLVPVSDAGAAVRARAHQGHGAASRIGTASARLRALLVHALEKAGITIDPNGFANDGNH